MKHLKSLKLNQISKAELEKREMTVLVGGYNCGCGCYYAGTSGGSSTGSNYSANVASGYGQSYGGNVACGNGVPTYAGTH